MLANGMAKGTAAQQRDLLQTRLREKRSLAVNKEGVKSMSAQRRWIWVTSKKLNSLKSILHKQYTNECVIN